MGDDGSGVGWEYQAKLAELKINSKPLINCLTMMAEDYIRQAPVVVQTIEKQLLTVRPEMKLPILYLIDSIIKNVRKEYGTLFTQNIVSTFTKVFETADDKVRQLLYKLRATWNDIFPAKKLQAIDAKCNSIDPKWPMLSGPAPGSIHVNPRFIKANTHALLSPTELLSKVPGQMVNPVVNTAETSLDSASEVQMRAQLLAKQKELLELQTRKVELELLQTKMQMEQRANANRQQSESLNEGMLLGMAETARNRTELIQQKLSNLHPKPPPITSLKPIQDSLSDREILPSTSLKSSKSHTDASGSSIEGSPSKSKPSRSSRDKEKSSRDKRDRNKSESSRDRHDSKEKESRHRHREKSRHGDHSTSSNKDKDKDKNRVRERSREVNSGVKSSGEWKDYNEAKKVSPIARTHRKDTIGESDDDKMDGSHDIKPLRKILPSVDHPPSTVHVKNEVGSGDDVDMHPTKVPSSGESSGSLSPLKRKLPKDKAERERSKEKDVRSEKQMKEKEKAPIISDPRLRRRERLAKNVPDEKPRELPARDPATKPINFNDYRARQQKVLSRNYRKTASGTDTKDSELPSVDIPMNDVIREGGGPLDVDLRRFEPPFDVDLRSQSDGAGAEPPAKKPRDGTHGAIVDLFGHQDVDLRAGSSCWSQRKLNGDVEDGLKSQLGNIVDNDVLGRDMKLMRSPGPPSPTNSVVSSTSSVCDPLGRPLLYNRLSTDPETRKKNLEDRSQSIDAVEQFKTMHIDKALQHNGIMTQDAAELLLMKAKEEHDKGLLNEEQFNAVMKQIIQVKETSSIKEVQQMQMSAGSWQMSPLTTTNIPNPWITGNDNGWNSFGPVPQTGMGNDFSVVPFAGPNSTPWETPKPTPWAAPNMPLAPAGPNPFVEAIRPTLVDDFVPKANKKDLHMAEQDVGRAIPIDKVYRQLRFYRDEAVVMTGVNDDEPRDLTFQLDDRPRTILINGKPLEIFLDEEKKFDLCRVTHVLRIGPPGRELCIDDKRYELFFGGRPKNIFIDGRSHTFQYLPPSPQVSVGTEPRHDLCAGRVTLTIDAIKTESVFLDEKLQKIEIAGEPVVLRFRNGFQTVSLNGREFQTNFGARLPFSITLPNSEKHYLRFNAVSPSTEAAIRTYISMKNSGANWEDGRGAPFGRNSRGGNRANGRGRIGAKGRREMPEFRQPGPNPWATEPAQEAKNSANPLDLLNNIMQAKVEPHPRNSSLDQSYESEQSMMEQDSRQADTDKSEESAGPVNVVDLFASLVKFGLLPAAPASTTDNQANEAPVEAKKEPNSTTETKPTDDVPVSKEPEAPSIPPLPTVDVTFDDNLKERREVVIAQLYTGVQCSQCGLRFPPDQTVKYSQHLDWHFRKNRREKANARKALSRKWYYDLSDWIQFEEIEDLEERAASLFETQDMDADGDSRSPAALNPEDYTVLSSSHPGAVCPQCNESFESFFDEEREEWRLRNAKLDEYEGEAKLYHPICHQDYLKSLVEESVIEEDHPENSGDNKENEEKDMAVQSQEEEEEEDEVLIIKEGPKEVVVMEIDIDDDDVEKTETTVNLHVNEEESNKIVNVGTKTDDNVTDKENYNIENDFVKHVSDNSSLDANAARSSSVQSPILIDEDSSFLPGLGDETEGGVFGVALGSGSRGRQIRTEDVDPEEKKIVYEPMKFDIPQIKIKSEPVDEETVEEPASAPEDFMSNLQPFLPSLSSKSPSEIEPMNIDLTAEDSSDAVDCGARLVTQIRTSIDGNLQHDDTTALPFLPAPKIRINLSDIGGLSVSSEKSKEKADSLDKVNNPGSESEAQDKVMIKDDGNTSNVVSNESQINNTNPNELELSEETKRLKPRLVGTKLTNYPMKMKGKEESGLCVIC